MAEIKVVKNLGTLPSKGRYIGDQRSKCDETPEGFPMVSLNWESRSFFSKETWLGPAEQSFVFAEQAVLMAELPEEAAKSAARAAGWVEGAGVLPYGGLLTLVAGALGSNVANTWNMKGIAVLYKNEKEKSGIFDAVSAPAVVDRIVASVSPDKIVSYDELKAEYRKHSCSAE